MQLARRLGIAVMAVVVTGACTGAHARRTAATASPATTAVVTAPTTTAPTTASPPVALDADVAGLPAGNGHRLAIVVDDVGLADDFLDGYLALGVPVTFAVMPFAPHATDDDTRIHAAGRQDILHIPLANSGRDAVPGGLRPTASAADIDAYLTAAVARVPHAEGANNHQGAFGPTVRPFMEVLLRSLQARNLFFLDSVTTQRTVGFSTAVRLGFAPRINNVFMDHFETDADSRAALLDLARVAAASPSGGAIGICHVFHPYEMHALQTLAPQLIARGYVFAPLSAVTDGPAPAGLDRGVAA